jgi:hypothetical protein
VESQHQNLKASIEITNRSPIQKSWERTGISQLSWSLSPPRGWKHWMFTMSIWRFGILLWYQESIQKSFQIHGHRQPNHWERYLNRRRSGDFSH